MAVPGKLVLFNFSYNCSLQSNLLSYSYISNSFFSWYSRGSPQAIHLCSFDPSLIIFCESPCFGTIQQTAFNQCIINVSFSLLSLTYPHKKKSRGVISGDRGGQGVGPSLPVYLFRNVASKNRRTYEPQCGGAPSCWKIIHGWNSSEVQHKVPTCPCP